MKKLPCEKAIWETIPMIRKAIACCMIHDFSLSQKEAAELLNITPAAVSQYRCNKRVDIEITDLSILNEIKKSTRIIIKNGTVLETELCRICRLMNKNNQCPI
jgi:predicted transcriptional regulator